MKYNNIRLFSKDYRATKYYSIAHVAAFNMVAALCDKWQFKYLFHDFEKPFLMLLWNDYKRVQKYHRTHSSHHLEYHGTNFDYTAMCIDWECSKYTKSNAQLDCSQTIAWYIKRNNKQELQILCGHNNNIVTTPIINWEIVKSAKSLGLFNKTEYVETMNMTLDEINKIKTSEN